MRLLHLIVSALFAIDLSQLKLQSGLIGKESVVGGEEFVRRSRAGSDIPLDACAWQAFRENPHAFPESFKSKTNGSTYVYFPATVIRGPRGNRYVLYLCWEDGGLRWDHNLLGSKWFANGPAGVLA